MRPLPILAAIALAAYACPAGAQTLGGGRQRLTVLFGASGTDQRDEAVSPLRYSGWGAGGAVRYDVETLRSRTLISASVVSSHLNRVTSSSTPSSGAEVGVVLGGRHLRRVRSGANTRVFVGGALDASVTARTQRFISSYHTDHLAGVATLAPALRIERDRGVARILSYDLKVPVVTALIRSYADAHIFYDAGERSPAWKGPDAARALTQTIAYAARLNGHLGLRAEIQSELFQYSSDPAHRGARTLVAMGFTWWTRPK